MILGSGSLHATQLEVHFGLDHDDLRRVGCLCLGGRGPPARSFDAAVAGAVSGWAGAFCWGGLAFLLFFAAGF